MDTKKHIHHYSSSIALGKRLHHWRMGENRKIADVADQLCVSTATWGHWETGEHLPSGDMLLAIEVLTGMPLSMLFCRHLDTCPLANTGHMPSAGVPCCQCAIAPFGEESVPDHQENLST